jgi:hypothetical protein
MERRPQFCGGRGPHHLGFSVQYDAWLPPCNHSGHLIIVRLPLRRQSSALGSADIRRTKNLRGTRHVDLDQRVAGSEAASLAHAAQGSFGRLCRRGWYPDLAELRHRLNVCRLDMRVYHG